MDREDLGAGRERQDAGPPAGPADAGEAAGGPSPDLVASTVEALRARIDEGDRDALRGTLAPPPAQQSGDPERDPS